MICSSRCILLLEDLDAAFTRSVSRGSTSTGVPIVPLVSAKTSKENSDGSTLSLSGLLNSLDGVAAAEGRYVPSADIDRKPTEDVTPSLLFATTNHIERLDPALSRPGRMDVWINFTHATKWQAEGLFKCFFPATPSTEPSESSERGGSDASQCNLPLPKRKRIHALPLLAEEEIAELARKFAEQIPEDELSVRCPTSIQSVRYTEGLRRWPLCRGICSRIRPGRVSVLTRSLHG